MKALLFYTTSGDLIKKFTDFNNSDDALRQVEEEFMQGKDEEYIFCHKKLSFAESCANHNAVAQASFQKDYNGFQKLTNLIGANRNVENLSISVIVEKDEKKVQILADIRDNYQNLRNNEFNNDKFLVKEAINVNSKALQYASSVLKNDREVVLKCKNHYLI